MDRKKIVIVESPSKIKPIGGYLGRDYVVIASAGHVRQIQRKPNAVTFKNGAFKFQWELDEPKVKNIISSIKKTNPDEIIIATDGDREGFGIAASIYEIIRDNKINTQITRMTFYEITKEAILDALKERTTNVQNALANAYLVRVGLDYSIGFTLSPILWKFLTCFKESSAGRVQSPTLFQIVSREQERNNFKSKVSYSISANLKKDKIDIDAKLTAVNGEKVDAFRKQEEANSAADDNKWKGKFTVKEITSKSIKIKPPEPFITSSLQQECSNRLGMPVAQCMRIAQDLYENGLISYMRTDSVAISDSFMKGLREYINNNYSEFKIDKVRVFKKEIKNAQEAHECIRPTDIARTTEAKEFDDLTTYHKSVYDAIRNRTLACQMADAVREQTTIILSNDTCDVKHNHSRLTFLGFKSLYGEVLEDALQIKKGDEFKLVNKEVIEHETDPPARYSEASIIKDMEEKGIGRPSTYEPTIKLLKNRELVNMSKKYLVPTVKGEFIALFLKKFLPKYIDHAFTASMEDTLDKVARGECQVHETLDKFLKELEEDAKSVLAIDKASAIKGLEEMFGEVTCDSCKEPMHLGIRFSPYWSCSTCKQIKKLSHQEETVDLTDDKFEIFEKGTYRIVKYAGKDIFIPSFMKMDLDINIVRFLAALPKVMSYKGSNVLFGYSKRGFYASYKKQFYNCTFENVYNLKNEEDCSKLMDSIIAQ